MATRALARTARVIAALVLAGLSGNAAPAAQPCPLGRATYGAGDGYTLQFYPNARSASTSQSNSFVLRREGYPAAILVGGVIWNQGISRPQGALRRNCPPDARTNEDFEACTAWEGIVYALGESTAMLLPGEDEPAPPALLLPDFGRAMRYSGPFNDVHDAGDVFTLIGCRL